MRIDTVKCPCCKTELGVKIRDEEQKVKCPVCGYSIALSRLGNNVNDSLGVLIAKVLDEEVRFELHEGKNVVGRDADGSNADFRIDTKNDKFMSREHIVVTVVYEPDEGYVHYVSLYKKSVNPTFLNGTRINGDDKLKLKKGDLLKLPGATVVLELPDIEKTQFDV
jgi:pSer/pThr/pTyr-binding forkhead associated (FHA) protein